jgi:amino acid transporter
MPIRSIEPRESEDQAHGSLRRTIGTYSLTALAVTVMVGSGIFKVPASVAALVGSPEAFLLMWVAGGLVTLCLALSLAELAAMFPRTGGLYCYLIEAFGRGTAFNFIWTYVVVNPASWAAIALVFAAALASVVGLGDGAQRFTAAALIVVVATVNVVSVRFAVALQAITSTAKFFALMAVTAVLFAVASPLEPVVGATTVPVSAMALGTALVLVLLPYDGVSAACALAGEARDPQRTLPRALIAAVAVVTAVYVLINAAYLHVLPLAVMASSPLVAVDAMEAAVGRGAEVAIAAVIMLSTFGTVAAISVSDPRVLFAPARDGLFPPALGAVHGRFGTPYVAIAVSVGLALVYLSSRSFEQVAGQYVLGIWLYYGAACAGLIWLRVRRPDLQRPFRVPLYPLVPGVAVLSAVVVLAAALADPVQRPGALVNLGVSAVGVPAWYAWRRRMLRSALAGP